MSGLSPARAFTMAIPKGCSSEERVAGKEPRPVEVVTASGEHQNPENCHARYPSGRHHCHAALPHVILCQHRQKTITLSHPYAERFMNTVHVYAYVHICLFVYFYWPVPGLICTHSTFRSVVHHASFTQTIIMYCFFIRNLGGYCKFPSGHTFGWNI